MMLAKFFHANGFDATWRGLSAPIVVALRPLPHLPWQGDAQSSSYPSDQKRLDQMRQGVTIATFKNGSCRNCRFPEPLAKARKIFRFEAHLRDRIVSKRVEPRRNQEQIGLEFLQHPERLLDRAAMLRPRTIRSHGKIMNLA